MRVGPGTLWLQLELTLEGLPADKLVNRHVRPLLKALTKVTSQPVSYFGRDWISMAHRPVGFVGFAHDAAKDTGLLEAVIGVDEAFVPAPRASFMGKEPTMLNGDRQRLLGAVIAAYGLEARGLPEASAVTEEPPWTATQEEAIGVIAAGRDAHGRLRLGGEFMASSDAVARLEEALASSSEDLERIIDNAFAGATLFGAKLESIRDVLVKASSASSS